MNAPLHGVKGLVRLVPRPKGGHNMATSSEQSTAITVPADYLDDIRSALVAEIHDDSEMLQTNQVALEESGGSHPEMHLADRDSSLGLLRTDVEMLNQLFGVSGGVTLTADPGSLDSVLERMARLLIGRLGDECEYAPIKMDAVLALVGRLRWAAEEADRLNAA